MFWTRRELIAGAAAGWLRQLAAAAPAPEWREQQEEFLRNARLVRVEDVQPGVTGSRRILLRGGHLTHPAHWQSVDQFYPSLDTGSGTELNLHDCYVYNLAAYEIDKLLGLGMVPTAVERKIEGRPSAVSWWVDDVAMTELERKKQHQFPSDMKVWLQQDYIRRVFDQLIANTDRNQSNILITRNWEMWLIDHTRAFRRDEELRSPRELVHCDRSLLAGLSELTETSVSEAVKGHLSTPLIRALLKRRDRIVELFSDKITRFGEQRIVYDYLAQHRRRA